MKPKFGMCINTIDCWMYSAIQHRYAQYLLDELEVSRGLEIF